MNSVLPTNATSWVRATDEVYDLARTSREMLDEYDNIKRAVYVDECARLMVIERTIIGAEVEKRACKVPIIE